MHATHFILLTLCVLVVIYTEYIFALISFCRVFGIMTDLFLQNCFFLRLCIPLLLMPFCLPLTHPPDFQSKLHGGKDFLYFFSSSAANTQKKDNKNRFFPSLSRFLLSFSHSFTHSFLSQESRHDGKNRRSERLKRERHKSMLHEKKNTTMMRNQLFKDHCHCNAMHWRENVKWKDSLRDSWQNYRKSF